MTTTERPPLHLVEPTQPVSELDDETPRSVAVDQEPEPKVTTYDRITARRQATIRPVFPDWCRSPRTARSLFVFFAWYYLHIVLFHLVRIPTSYQVQLLPRALPGLFRLVADIAGGITDSEGRPLRKSAVRRDDVKDYLHLVKERNARVRHRAVALAVLAVPVLCIVLGLVWFAPWWLQLPAAVLAADALGGYWIARKGQPVFPHATTPAHLAPPLRADIVETAIRALPGYGEKATLEFPEPIIRDGEGWMATVRLKQGYTATKILGLKEELASGLRRPTGAVWPEGDEDDASIVKLWVGFQAFGKMKMPAYPAGKRPTDFFRDGGIPYGRTQRMAPIGLRMFENNLLLGGLPGAGKSVAMRCILVGCARDPIVQLRLWNLKQNDFAELETVAHTFGYGQTEEVFAACMADLRDLAAEVQRRTDVLSKVQAKDRALCPDGKLTRQLAERRDLGLEPIVMALDEVAFLFEHEKYGAEAEKLCRLIIRLGRAYGIVLILATQRPDKDAIPKSVASLFSVRICMRMTDYATVDMVLGTGAHGRGLKAELFKDSEKGIGYILGVTNDDLVGRSYYLDGPAAGRVVEHAREVRESLGRLSGYALTVQTTAQEAKAEGFDLLVDIEDVMIGQGLDWMWNAAACGALETLRPGAYSGLTETSLGQMLAKRGVPTRQMNRVDPQDPPGSKRQNRTGFELADIRAAIESRKATA